MPRTERTPIYLYRGLLIHWYRLTCPGGRTRYQTAWEYADTWHQSPARRTIDQAVRDAETLINTQLADRPAERSA